jgi:RimK family alpha-L-glutamate ligase
MDGAEPRPRASRLLRFAILGEPSGWHVRRLATALADRGHRVDVVRWAELAAGVDAGGERFAPEPLDVANVVAVRGMPGGPDPHDRLEEVVFRLDVLGRLAARGTPVVNGPRALEAAIDKYLSLARLAAAGLPVPRTMVVQDAATAVRAWSDLGGDCVVKPLFGSRGRGVKRLSDAAALERWLATDAGGSARVRYLQEFVPHGGWDARLLVVGGNVSAMRRLAPEGDWRTNISLGGRGEAFTPPAAWTDLARRAAEVLEAEVVGVDIAPAPGGPVVLEANAVPGWRGLEAATGTDVAGLVADHLESRATAG